MENVIKIEVSADAANDLLFAINSLATAVHGCVQALHAQTEQRKAQAEIWAASRQKKAAEKAAALLKRQQEIATRHQLADDMFSQGKTVLEVALELGVTERTVYTWIRQGHCPAYVPRKERA